MQNFKLCELVPSSLGQTRGVGTQPSGTVLQKSQQDRAELWLVAVLVLSGPCGRGRLSPACPRSSSRCPAQTCGSVTRGRARLVGKLSGRSLFPLQDHAGFSLLIPELSVSVLKETHFYGSCAKTWGRVCDSNFPSSVQCQKHFYCPNPQAQRLQLWRSLSCFSA